MAGNGKRRERGAKTEAEAEEKTEGGKRKQGKIGIGGNRRVTARERMGTEEADAWKGKKAKIKNP